MDHSSTDYALLATQSALLDIVTSELRAVVVNAQANKNLFYIRFYYDGDVSEETIEDWGGAITEATADLSLSPDGGLERMDYPRPIPMAGRLAYLRREPEIQSNRLIANKQSIKREFISADHSNHIYISPYRLSASASTRLLVHHGLYTISYVPIRINLMDIDIRLETYSLLAIQRALLGRVTPELRAVFTQVIEGSVHVFIRFFYEGPISGDLMDTWELALSEVMADFGEGYSFDMAIEQLPYPQKIPFKGRYAYLKKGGQIWDS